MSLFHEFRSLFVLFYIFGQTSSIPLKTDHSRLLTVFSTLIRIAYIVPSIWNIATDFYVKNRFAQPKSETFGNLVLCLVVIINFLPILLTFYSNAISQYSSSRICDLFANLIQYIKCNLKCSIDIDIFKREFTRKLIFQIAFEIVATISRYISEEVSIDQFHHACFTFWKIITIFAVSHIIFYVNLIEFTIKTVNSSLVNILHNRKRLRRIFVTLRHVKWFHYNLLQILVVLNERFGLLCLVFLIHYFFVGVLTMFRTLTLWPKIVIISKFEFLT